MSDTRKTQLDKGVFSTLTKSTVGFGHTKRKVDKNVYVFGTRNEDGSYTIQALNQKGVPSGPKREVASDEMMAEFIPEPEMYLKKVRPRIEKLEQTVDRGDRHRSKGELYAAEFEYAEALAIDEEHIRATFGMGLIHMERGDLSNAEKVFQKVVALDAAFGQDHKHLFNEFGIQLRKNRMYSQARSYYQRALELCEDDEHLLYNISRAMYETGEIDAARAHLEKALELNPGFVECRKFLDVLEKAPAAPKAEAGKEDKPPAKDKKKPKGSGGSKKIVLDF